MGKQTVADVIELHGDQTKKTFAPLFEKSGVMYPPNKLALIAFKDSKILEVWAANDGGEYSLITQYPIQAASGVLGPKLKEGDRQVPEGLYTISGFNPNSSYHLSMKINYPNEFDLKHAKKEGRDQPGSNIFIHGRSASIGCLAMGDSVIEQLFTLVHKTQARNTIVLISPTDPSKHDLIVPNNAPVWVGELYEKIYDQYRLINKL